MSTPSMPIARRILVLGRVQGVGYRRWLADQADAAGLAGWVRNRADGAVEALIVGMPTGVDALVNAARRGPPMAGVSHVEVTDQPVPDGLDGFAIHQTR